MITSKIIKILPAGLRKSLEQNDDFKKIVGNINWLTFENILRSLVGLIIFAWIARYLGPDQFGVMNYAFAFVSLFAILATLGLDNIVIRDIIANPEKEKEYLGSTLLLKFLGAIVTMIASVAAISIIEPGDNTLRIFVLIMASMYIFKSFDAIDLWFQSKIQSKYSVYSRSIAFVVITAIKIFLILTKAPLYAFVITFTGEMLIASLLLIIFYTRQSSYPISKWRIQGSLIKDLLKNSWPLLLGGIAAVIYMKIDQVMIGKMLGDTEVGLYYSAVKLSETWYFIPTIIGASVYPAILNAKKKSEVLYKKRLQILFDFSAWFAIAISLAICVTSPWIIKILYGPEYAAAASVLSVHIWSGVFVFLGIIAGKWVIAENYTKNALIRTAIGAVLNIALNYILLPKFGIMGAAVATLISYSFVNYFSLFFSKKTRVCFVMQTNAFNIFRVFRIKKIAKYILKKIKSAYKISLYEFRNKHSHEYGIQESQRKTPIVITLTTYPKRYDVVHLTLESLLDQTMKPDQIVLWISSEEGNDSIMPEKILRLKQRGVTIKYVEGNIRSYKKLIYALEEYSNALLITVDDDTIYPVDFVKNIYKIHTAYPDCIIANRCTYMSMNENGDIKPYMEWSENREINPSFNQFPTGVGGILYPPKSLHKEVFNKEAFMDICPSADDVWFKAMGVMNNTQTYFTGMGEESLITIKKAQKDSLWKVNVVENKNDIQIQQVFEKYNLNKYLK